MRTRLLRIVGAVAALVLTASTCSSGDSETTTTTEPEETTSTTSPIPPARSPFYWPHSGDSVWNVGLGSGAQFAPDDDPVVRSLRGEGSDASPAGISFKTFTHPIAFATESDPLLTIAMEDRLPNGSVTCFVDRGAGGESRQKCDQTVQSVEMRVPAGIAPDPGNCTPTVPGPTCEDGQNTDGSMHIVQPDGKTLYSMFRVFGEEGNWAAARIAKWDLTNSGIAAEPDQQWGTRAYGGSDVAGLIRCWELEKVVSGEWSSFPHALALAMSGSQLKAGATQRDTFIWPATTSDSGWQEYRGAVPMGALVAVPPGVSADLSGPLSQAILETFKNYGGYVVDRTGGQFAVYIEPGCGLDDAVSRANNLMSKIQSVATVVTNNSIETLNGGGTYPPPPPPLKVGLDTPYEGSFFPPIS